MKGFLNKNQRQKQIISRLKNENDKLRQIIGEQDRRIKYLETRLEQALLQIEELQRIIFGKKKGRNNNDQNNDKNNSSPTNSNDSRRRDPLSYRRPVPSENEVTSYQKCHIDNCPTCGQQLTNIKVVVRYLEDLLPLTEWHQALKRVTKKFITTGYCSRCQKRVASEPLSKQTVSLGKNVKQFVSFSNIILRLSYQQISDILTSCCQFNLSDGEITNILEKQANQLLPEYERLLHNIRGQPGAHYDETSWSVQKDSATGGNYAWIMTGTETSNTIFSLGKNRGKGNALELKGKNNNEQVGITDDYGAYQNLFRKHQLCWSHPHRKLRDLKDSDCLPIDKREHCQNVYESFTELYQKVQTIVAEPFIKEKREKSKKQLMAKFDQIVIPQVSDPVKLRKIKERLRKQKECYFTCIIEQGIPPDNNKAERALRHLVLKRKNSYGSKTQKGALNLSILCSVLLSYWWQSKLQFFKNYTKLLSN